MAVASKGLDELTRHCERSDAIQKSRASWIASPSARNDEVDGPCSKASKCHNVVVA
jgi:hypothetical protein